MVCDSVQVALQGKGWLVGRNLAKKWQNVGGFLAAWCAVIVEGNVFFGDCSEI
jgi:hypothetical protein